MSGISADKTYEVALKTYIPSGYKVVSEDTTLKVNVKVSRRVSIHIPYENIELKGAKDLYDYDIVRDKNGIVVYVIGDKDKVEKLTVSDFYPTVSVAGKNIGTHTIKIDLNPVNEGDFEIEEDVYLNVTVAEKPTEPEPTEPETEEPESAEAARSNLDDGVGEANTETSSMQEEVE